MCAWKGLKEGRYCKYRWMSIRMDGWLFGFLSGGETTLIAASVGQTEWTNISDAYRCPEEACVEDREPKTVLINQRHSTQNKVGSSSA